MAKRMIDVDEGADSFVWRQSEICTVLWMTFKAPSFRENVLSWNVHMTAIAEVEAAVEVVADRVVEVEDEVGLPVGAEAVIVDLDHEATKKVDRAHAATRKADHDLVADHEAQKDNLGDLEAGRDKYSILANQYHRKNFRKFYSPF
jgi:hypothetical protein